MGSKGSKRSSNDASYIELTNPLKPEESEIEPSEEDKYRFIKLDGESQPPRFPSNSVKNTKYNPLTFVPLVLFHQFKFFYNLFFLMITVSQFFPPLQVGFLFTYLAPLVFVLTVTMVKEAYDDLVRWKRDKEVNNEPFEKLSVTGLKMIPASDIKVGDLIYLKSNERIPADMLLLWTSEESGNVFIRTDQLDGETDWKLRTSVAITQDFLEKQGREKIELLGLNCWATAKAPTKNIYKFEGTVEFENEDKVIKEALSLDNTIWASTVITTGEAIGLVIYTGKETRSVMNSSSPEAKSGICDKELNFLSELLFMLMLIIAFMLLVGAGFNSSFYILFFRFLLLLSNIIPISLRVNLDMAKIWYSFLISTDSKIDQTIARNSNIPEELGRIQYIMTDKTGTLTQNEMIFKKLFLPFGLFSVEDPESMEELNRFLFTPTNEKLQNIRSKQQRSMIVQDFFQALALCHNVTPVFDDVGVKSYQASSPDEIALVKFADSVGMELKERRQEHLVIQTPEGKKEHFTILRMFPFSSSSKRMGIIIQNRKTHKIRFFLKGAEDVMQHKIVHQDKSKTLEDCGTLANEGLRTLVVAQRELSQQEYNEWENLYEAAAMDLNDRDQKVSEAISLLEVNLEVLGVTGVEDKLQVDVQYTIRNMRSAGIALWVLTGDKVETAECIAISTDLKSKTEMFHRITGLTNKEEAEKALLDFNVKGSDGYVLVIDGNTLQLILGEFDKLFIEAAGKTSCVVCCRVAPTQKTQIVEAVKKYTGMRICSIGDGGNDVGMIQAAHVGIGIEGKEGKQASLAADYAVFEFRVLTRLILWHGRNSYKRTAKLSNFVYHRGLVISVIEAIFTCLFRFCAIPIFNGYLMLGYATAYTMMPVFSIVLDEDADFEQITTFPKLYERLLYGRELNFTKFMIWLIKSIYQGSVIMLLSLLIFPSDSNFVNIVAITFTTLIFTELFNVMTEIERFHWAMGVSEVATILIYLLSMFMLKTYFDLNFVFSLGFIWRVLVILLIAWLPIHVGKMLNNKFDPPDHKKIG